MFGRDRSHRKLRCLPRLGSATGLSSWTSAGFNGSTSSCPAEVWTYGKADVEFQLPCSSNILQDGNRRFGTLRHDHVPNTSQWSQHRSGAGFPELGKKKKRSQWRAFIVVRYNPRSRLAADYHLLPVEANDEFPRQFSPSCNVSKSFENSMILPAALSGRFSRFVELVW